MLDKNNMLCYNISSARNKTLPERREDSPNRRRRRRCIKNK